jgi:DNA topoisomerase-1
MLDNFWKDFVKDLENADETAVKMVEKIGKKCPECGAELLMKYGKNGKFIACENFPECKYTEELEEERKKREALEKQV